MTSNYLDKLYREIFENKEVLPTSTSWSDMERLLNQHTNKKNSVKRFWLLTFTLLLISSSILVYEIYTSENESTRPTKVNLPINKTSVTPKSKGHYAEINSFHTLNKKTSSIDQLTKQINIPKFTTNTTLPMSQHIKGTTEVEETIVVEISKLTISEIDLVKSKALAPIVILHPEPRIKKLDIQIKEEMLTPNIEAVILEENNNQEQANLSSKVIRSIQEKASLLYIAASERNIIHQ